VIFEVLAEGNPEATEEELGERVGAVNSFILEHEFGHALIANYELPVLGKEEDAADSIATVLLLKAGEGADYADNHSLDLQRAFDILCWVAGSSEQSFEEVAELEALPESRLASCPGESNSWSTASGRSSNPTSRAAQPGAGRTRRRRNGIATALDARRPLLGLGDGEGRNRRPRALGDRARDQPAAGEAALCAA
jgi:hypothetical protein